MPDSTHPPNVPLPITDPLETTLEAALHEYRALITAGLAPETIQTLALFRIARVLEAWALIGFGG